MINPPAPSNALTKLEKLTFDEVEYVIKMLDRHVAPHLVQDVSSYAPGRNRVWMPYEAPLDYPGNYTRPFIPGLLDSKIWTIVLELCGRHGFVPDTCLISKGGTIKPHRDTTYAASTALGINLGVCSWHISSSRDSSKTDYTMELSGGEMFTFNCKHTHAVTNSSPDRWSINAWTIADTSASRNACIPERLKEMHDANPEVLDFIYLAFKD